MTTSFTSTSFSGTETTDDFGEFKSHPSAFGITFTPTVTGMAFGVGGFLIAAYLVLSHVLPAQNSHVQLQRKMRTTEQELENLRKSKVETQIQAKKAELQEAQDIQAEVIKLFAHENSLETLLIDLNSFVNATNIKLNSYIAKSEPVVYDSFGESVNWEIKAKTYNLNVKSSFAQLQLFLQDIERLQPLLVIKDFNTNITEPQNYVLRQDRVVVTGQPKLETSMTINALFPNMKKR